MIVKIIFLFCGMLNTLSKLDKVYKAKFLCLLSMFAKIVGLMLVALPLCRVSLAQERSNVTLCPSGEEVYFSCPLENNKIVSICGKGNHSPGEGYVQYRYGLPGHEELIYPTGKTPPAGIFQQVDASEGSVKQNLIKFKVDGYTYAVNQAFISFLSVKNSSGLVLIKYCKAGGSAHLSAKARKGIALYEKTIEDIY